jgi:hypothetical protein
LQLERNSRQRQSNNNQQQRYGQQEHERRRNWYSQQVQRQQQLAAQRERLLQQQRRMAQWRYQQRYLAYIRQQELRLRNARYNDQYYSERNIYRYNRGGRYYETNQYGANMLRQALNNGYEQGYNAGLADREDGWRSSGYQDSFAYDDATYGYDGYYVDENEYRHYFREGFRRGYEDGYNSRSQYGYRSNGKWEILTAIVSQILNLQSY